MKRLRKPFNALLIIVVALLTYFPFSAALADADSTPIVSETSAAWSDSSAARTSSLSSWEHYINANTWYRYDKTERDYPDGRMPTGWGTGVGTYMGDYVYVNGTQHGLTNYSDSTATIDIEDWTVSVGHTHSGGHTYDGLLEKTLYIYEQDYSRSNFGCVTQWRNEFDDFDDWYAQVQDQNRLLISYDETTDSINTHKNVSVSPGEEIGFCRMVKFGNTSVSDPENYSEFGLEIVMYTSGYLMENARATRACLDSGRTPQSCGADS